MEITFGSHQPWEWGWDAGVAIGTLLLALVTVVAVFVPLWIEHFRRREVRAQRQYAGKLLALSLVDELVAVDSCLPGLRSRLAIAAKAPVTESQWEAIVAIATRADFSLLSNRINDLTILEDVDACAVVEAFAALTRLRAALQPAGLTNKQIALNSPQIAGSILGISVIAQTSVGAALQRLWPLTERTHQLSSNPETELTDEETAILSGS